LLFYIWYKYCDCDDDNVCGIETKNDWVVIGLWNVWDIRSVYKLYVNNLGPPYIGGTLQNLSGLLYENYIKKNYHVFHLICDWCFILEKGMLHVGCPYPVADSIPIVPPTTSMGKSIHLHSIITQLVTIQISRKHIFTF